jgi:hypothetical protein
MLETSAPVTYFYIINSTGYMASKNRAMEGDYE